MRRISLLAVLVAGFLAPAVLLAATPPPDMEAALAVAAATACSPPAGCAIVDFARSEVVPGIVHYSAVVQVGAGTYDRIAVHRVVREIRPGYPIKAPDRIMLHHGDAKNFVGMFLPASYSPDTPAGFGIAIYLARNGVDVWGIDQAWTLVPSETAELGFMENWGLQRTIDDLGNALAIARETRRLMGSGGDRFNLLGYSSGGVIGWALVNQEAAIPKGQRHVQGFIPADIGYKSVDLDWLAFWSADLAYQRSQYEQAVFGSFVPFAMLGNLARNDPDGSSPMLPGLTNLQAALYFGAGPLFGAMPIHYLAGVFDEYGLPTDLQYVSTPVYLDFLESAIVWQPTRFFVDYDEVMSDAVDTPFDDHLADVTVPIYNWGAAGGVGPYGTEMLRRVGSSDTEEHFVNLHPPEEVLLEFGHIDLFIADDAPELAWKPLLEWLQAHR